MSPDGTNDNVSLSRYAEDPRMSRLSTGGDPITGYYVILRCGREEAIRILEKALAALQDPTKQIDWQ